MTVSAEHQWTPDTTQPPSKYFCLRRRSVAKSVSHSLFVRSVAAAMQRELCSHWIVRSLQIDKFVGILRVIIIIFVLIIRIIRIIILTPFEKFWKKSEKSAIRPVPVTRCCLECEALNSEGDSGGELFYSSLSCTQNDQKTEFSQPPKNETPTSDLNFPSSENTEKWHLSWIWLL